MKFILSITLWLSVFLSPAISFSEEYTFEIPEIEKKPYSIGGFIEARPALFGLDKDASLYKLRFYNRDEGATTYEYNARLQLDFSAGRGLKRNKLEFLRMSVRRTKPISGRKFGSTTRRSA